MTEVYTILREFPIFGYAKNTPESLDEPTINAQFVGVANAIAFDANNQPKLTRQHERQLKAIEHAIREQFEDELMDLGGDNLQANLTIIGDLLATFKHRLESDLLIQDQLDLESLTISGEWLTYWQADAPLSRAKAFQQDVLPNDF